MNIQENLARTPDPELESSQDEVESNNTSPDEAKEDQRATTIDHSRRETAELRLEIEENPDQHLSDLDGATGESPNAPSAQTNTSQQVESPQEKLAKDVKNAKNTFAVILVYLKYLGGLLFGGEASHTNPETPALSEEEVTAALNAYQELITKHIGLAKLPKKTTVSLNDIEELGGLGINSTSDLEAFLEDRPNVEELGSGKPELQAKFNQEISLMDYLYELKKYKPTTPTPSEDPEDAVEMSEVDPVPSVFSIMPEHRVDFSAGSSCRIELAGENHLPIVLRRNSVVINGKEFKVQLEVPIISDLDIKFDELSPMEDGGFNLKLHAGSNPGEAPFSEENAVTFITLLENNSENDSFQHSITDKSGTVRVFLFNAV